MIAMGMGDKDMADLAGAKRPLQGLDMVRQIGARIDHRDMRARAHDIDPGTLEGERSGVARQQACNEPGQAHFYSIRRIQRTVEIHVLLTSQFGPDFKPFPAL
jgi:hypothetical protein